VVPPGSAGFVLESVSVRYGSETALADVSLEIAPGEAVGLVGPSGAGKTTLLRLFNGSLRPTEGRVLFGGQDLSSLSTRRLRALRGHVAMVYQDHRLVPNLRVIRNVLSGRLGRTSLAGAARLLFFPPRREVRRVHDILRRVGIGEKLYERTDRLSGGQQQRGAIARALYQDPSALLPDEPVSSLDPARSRDTMELLRDLCRERGITLCASLHDLEIAQAFLPRLVGLRGGKIVFDRPTTELDEGDFHRLYELAPEEMLNDGP